MDSRELCKNFMDSPPAPCSLGKRLQGQYLKTSLTNLYIRMIRLYTYHKKIGNIKGGNYAGKQKSKRFTGERKELLSN